MPGNATVGQFVVGDGTLVGQTQLDATVVVGKATLVLNGKAFDAAIYTGDFIVTPFLNRPKLTLKAGALAVASDSTVAPGKSRLLLAGKAFGVIVPEFAHMGKSTLVLNAKSFALEIGGIVTVGKPALILKGKRLVASEVGLVPSIPWSLELLPTEAEDLVLTATVPHSLDLVPTVEEFR